PCGPQGAVGLGHGGGDAECVQAGDAVVADAAGDDAAVVAQVGVNVERDAVPTHPARDAYADRGDLRLDGVGLGDPDADAAIAALAVNAEPGEGANEPFFQPVHEAANISWRDGPMRMREVQHHVGNALTRPMVGPLATATGVVGRKPVGIYEFRK